MNALFPFMWTLGWAFVTQVLLFQHGIFWGGYGLLAIHLYGLLKMPVGWPPTTYLMVTAVTGACMDLVCLTGGMHLAASVTLGMAYPSLTAAFESRDGLRQGHVLDPYTDGWMRYAGFWQREFPCIGWSCLDCKMAEPPRKNLGAVAHFLAQCGCIPVDPRLVESSQTWRWT